MYANNVRHNPLHVGAYSPSSNKELHNDRNSPESQSPSRRGLLSF